MASRKIETRIWMIAGPTASGKSALALRLARSVGGEIVNADSMQLYRDLRILTARPAPAEEAAAPHHLFGVADAADGWSVGRWLEAARAVLGDIASRDRAAIVVGGTGLYFRALTKGLADIPATPRTVVERLKAETGGAEAAVRARLAKLDPQAEAKIAGGDSQRLLRALAVAEHTGRSLSAWRVGTRAPLAPDDWRGVVIEPPRAELYARCDARAAAMFESGAIAEAEALVARRLDPGLPAMKAVGAREILEHLEGRATRAEALARAQQATRNYAKRQLTWFRHQTPDWPRIEIVDPEAQWEGLVRLGVSAA
jgi:tRNA dimethylallyltransferase